MELWWILGIPWLNLFPSLEITSCPSVLTILFLLIYVSWSLWRTWVFSLYLYYAMVERGRKSPLYKIITFELADLSPAFLETRSEIYSFTTGFTATFPRKDVITKTTSCHIFILPSIISFALYHTPTHTITSF